jgi:hypothetical protein
MKPLQPQKSNTAEALEFAQSLAEKEINAIDRLHARTLKYLSIVATVFGLIAASIGFVGYKNLKETAVHTAQMQMRSEVSRQVEGVLKREDINSLVSQTVQQNANAEIEKIVTRETKAQVDLQLKAKESEITRLVSDRTTKTVDGMRPFIENTTISQVERTLTERAAPRHFSKVQGRALEAALSQFQARGDIEVRPYLGDPEQKQYGHEIASVLRLVGWSVKEAGPTDEDADISNGLTLIYSPDNRNQLSPSAIAIIDGFKAANVPLTFTYGQGRLSSGLLGRLVLVIGPKFR